MEYNPITVTDLNKYIKNKIDGDEMLNNVLVKGEISNFKNHYTGHMYFTLKDENSLIKCVMFKSYTTHLSFMPKDGMKVMVLGSVAVFERDGIYQIYAKAMKEDGLGSLYTAYEELKKKLEQEGLFAESHKKKIPFMPKTIGVLTSNTGAVIRDIINVSTRRNPGVHIRLYPVPVQGPGAAEKIAEGIKFMNENKLADVLIIGRGGGSLEDLWPFNEEIVARAIYDSELPIISAVGHETDFTIADFVADLRAPTPSAAAELAVANIEDVRETLKLYNNRYKVALKKKIELMRLSYEKCMARPAYKNPTQKINEQYMVIDMKVKALQNSMMLKLKEAKTSFVKETAKLDSLSPLKTLTRGYSIVTKQESGKVIKSVDDLNSGEKVNLRLSDGQKTATID
ncbi:MAG: exodeoxyribonuclease VII large subunit [Clostridium sp.]|jgi:exodeoxyribonuclease VII large subunit|nr:exodeoxyribonuclease VII large subunit [Clostridium sp.]PWM77243.1 MAG: exodeoxyribonuclease VII large subunit [Clostridium sp.]